MITEENKKTLVNRSKALLWSIGTMLAPVLVDFISTNMELFNLPSWLVVGLGLVLAQVTKYLNTPKVV